MTHDGNSPLLKNEKCLLSQSPRVIKQKQFQEHDASPLNGVEEKETVQYQLTDVNDQISNSTNTIDDVTTIVTKTNEDYQQKLYIHDCESLEQPIDQHILYRSQLNKMLPKSFPNLIEQVAKLYHRCSYIICRQFVFEIQTILKSLEQNEQIEGAMQWHASFKQSLDNIRQLTPEIQFLFEESNERQTLGDSFVQMFGEDMEQLASLKAFIVKYADPKDKDYYMSMIKRLKSEVICYNDVVTFKNILMEIEQTEYEHVSWDTSGEREMLQRGFDDIVQLYINVLDTLDLMMMSCKQNVTYGELWRNGLQEVCDALLDTIDQYNLQQIDVQNMLLDGKYMISIGTIPQQQVPHLKKFSVYEQIQRGFIHQSTQKVIREAKVITVY